MATTVRTIDFLPEIFKTKSNSQFLQATLDQLSQQPDFKRIQGYIGSKFGYGVKSTDKYLEEPTQARSNYQLEPGIVFKKTDTNIAKDILTYQGLVDTLRLEGLLNDNISNSLQNEFYSWDSFVDLDKVINFSQYYWLPFGPDSVIITEDQTYKNLTYSVTSTPTDYFFSTDIGSLDQRNPTLTLVRGGTYKFDVSQQSQFFIQTNVGVAGVESTRPNFSTREVYGVSDNGKSNGTITFTVPLANAQDEWNFPGNFEIDLATTLRYQDIQGKIASQVVIDGMGDYVGKTLLIYGNKPGSIGYNYGFYDDENSNQFGETFDNTSTTDINNYYYTINLIGDQYGNKVINLTQAGVIPNNTKITIKHGTEFIFRNFVKSSVGEILLIPYLTAKLNTLYYQDSASASKFGTIKLVDSATNSGINVNTIIGKKQYTSPNNIKFTNGLKVEFIGDVYPESYQTGQYYVEGVGTSIQLLPVGDFNIAENFGESSTTPFDAYPYDSTNYSDTLSYPKEPDYITIARNSISKNPWSRSNRWFHIDVLNETLAYAKTTTNVATALTDAATRAKRPILEFYPNLKLFNLGTISKPNVNFINFSATDAFSQVSGNTSFYPDGPTIELYDGATIIFAGDTNPEVRNKIFVANFESINGVSTPVITLSLAKDGNVLYNDQTVITVGDTYKGETFWFDGTDWILGQQKTRINQPPKFDIFDSNNISYGDNDFYPSTNFDGCTLFEYTIGSGVDDPILKFPIKYSSLNNLGDISFTVSLNSQTFNYVDNSLSITKSINNGYVLDYTNRTEYNRLIGWQTAIGESFQYQVFNTTYTGTPIVPTFTFDIAAKNQADTPWPVIVVYVNNARITSSEFVYQITDNSTSIILMNTPVVDTKVDVLIYSEQTSTTGYYQIPTNLDHNPFNSEVTDISLGDIRGHYKSICNNNPDFSGLAFGANNYRDLGNIIPYGTRVIQNSASVVPAGAFLRNPYANFFEALNFSGVEYGKFKALMLQAIQNNDYTSLDTSAYILDDIFEKISDTRINTNPFFYSDMLPNKNADVVNSYIFKSTINKTNFTLSRIYDFSKANYYGVLVYLTRRVNGQIRYFQLIKDVDYTISSTEKNLTVTKQLVNDDVITIKEYYQTYGSYVPNTPTKLGLYPAYLPSVVYDTSYVNPTYFIRGHDGSYNRLYGQYVDGYLNDIRDSVLLEFETRIYNNLKLSARIPVTSDEVVPGYFRNNNVLDADFLNVYTTQFLNWVGSNRINYQKHDYIKTDPFTYNYTGSILKPNKSETTIGGWRGLFKYFYDTTTPDTTPWEMLGLTIKPTWWDSYYGEAPYTSDNTFMWEDISRGFIYNNGDSYINPYKIRDGLLNIIPVDSEGNLKSPFEFLVSAYDANNFNLEWKVGDLGPAEYSYQKSSMYPFDLMRLLALFKPAQFFGLCIDVDNYKFNTEFNQYLYENRFRDSISNLEIYGNGTSKNSYINWIVDYLCQYGIDGYANITSLVNNLDVRLSYRMAGFSDKDLVNFFVEKGSPNSSNNSLMIPDDSYSIILYDNPANDVISYSSVIVQKVSATGYTVTGNNQNKTYFVSYLPFYDGLYETITVNNKSIKIPKTYTTKKVITPYGSLFNNEQELFTFMRGYGKYLTSQGMTFEDIENGVELTWDQMIAETLYWIQTGWDIGSIINVNPASRIINVDKENNVVQPLTLQKQNFILNQNSTPILTTDMNIFRQGTTFNVKALNEGDSMSFFNANLSTIEHVVIFNNETVFNDIIFNLVTGLRQQRIFVKGSKSAGWQGYVNAAGFIINQDNIEEWQENKKYSKGTIVKFKNNYYSAKEIVVLPKTKFDYNDWSKTSYDSIQKGLLPNPSTRSVESLKFYDTVNPNLSTDGDLLSFSLIGYRPRQYFASANFDDATQVNLYQNMIKVKGTVEGVTKLQGINVQQNTLNYDIHENWAIKSSEFGGLLNQNFVEFTLNESELTGNPSIVSLIKNVGVDGAQQEIPLNKIKNYGQPITSPNVLSLLPSTTEDKLPSAGYVNLDDVLQYSYNLNGLTDSQIYNLYKNDYVWIADKDNTWQIYTPLSYGANVISVVNNLNGYVIVTFDKPHNLLYNQVFGILNFNPSVDGYHLIEQIVSLTSVVIRLTLDANTTTITGSGLSFLMQSQRVQTARDIIGLPLLNAEYDTNRVWVDKNQNGSWTVYEKTNNYNESILPTVGLNIDNFGSSVAYVENVGYFVGDPTNGKVYHFSKLGNSFYLRNTLSYPGTSFGTTIVTSQDLVIISAPDDILSQIYVFKIPTSGVINSIILQEIFTIAGGRVGDAMAISGDGNWLYLGAKNDNIVLLYQRADLLTYEGSGLVLAQATTTGLNTFVCSGNVVTSLKEGQVVNFLVSYTDLAITLAQDTVELTNYFVVNGDQRSLLTTGDKVAFYDTGALETYLYTIVSKGYDPGSNTTTFYTVEEFEANIIIPTGNTVFKVTFNDELTSTIVTATYDDFTNKTTFFTLEDINYTATSGSKIFIGRINFELSVLVYSDLSNITSQYSASLTTNYDGSKFYVGAPKEDYSESILDTGVVYVYDRLIQNFEIQYDQNDAFLLVRVAWDLDPKARLQLNGVYIKPNKYVIILNAILIGVIGIKAGDIITVNSPNFVNSYRLTNMDNPSDLRPGELFGYSLDCNKYGSELFVGCPYDISNSNEKEGSVIRYTDEGKRYGRITGVIACNIIQPEYIYLNGYEVALRNETPLLANITAGVSNTVTISLDAVAALPTYGVVRVQNTSTGQFENLYYTSKNNLTGVLNCATTAIYSYTATSAKVILPLGDASHVALKINEAQITNVFAYSTEDARLIIRLRDNNLGQLNNKLNIFALNGNILFELGFFFPKSQVFQDPHNQTLTKFGWSIKHNEENSFVVSAPANNRYVSTKFDYSNDNNNHNDTVFDNNLTTFEDVYQNAGSVYMYDYVQSYDENLNSIGNYIYAQSLNDNMLDYGVQPYYGQALSFNNNKVMIGAPNLQTALYPGGFAMVWDNTEGIPNWHVYRQSDEIVDVSKIQKIQLYDNISNDNLVSMDYIDPLQGKLLGVVHENIDFISTTDPAGYNSPGFNKGNKVWTKSSVGKIWFNTTTTKFMNYHQNDLVYNSKHFGLVFPGSTVTVYSWIETNVIPALYTGPGTVYDYQKYSTIQETDSNNNLVTKYYYWVRNTNIVFKNKTLSDFVLERYIIDPINSGITYATMLRSNTFGLYNSIEYINNVSTNMHVGFSSGSRNTKGHVEFQLIRTNYDTDFLPGFPEPQKGYTYPTGLYDRLIDSLAGVDESGAVVPDPNLPKLLQLGINTRPRQGFFTNRLEALRNYIEYANAVVKQYPINEFDNITFLYEQGEYFNVTNYWENIYWWSDGYSDSTRAAMDVASYYDLLTLSVKEGTIVGVAQNSQGNREVYIYQNATWSRIGVQNGTIQFLSSLYDYSANMIGFGDTFYDNLSFDTYPSTETRYIIRALNEQIYVGPLLTHRNKSLILIFEYIQSETIESQNYLPWLNKTSFVDVSYNVRTLTPNEKYQRDNQSLLEGYIDEIKPYHVVMKEFYLKYDKLEFYQGDITDYDLPAIYNTDVSNFLSPQLVNGPSTYNAYEFLSSNAIWQNPNYTQWFNNNGLFIGVLDNIVMAKLTLYINTVDTIILVDDVQGFPVTGVIKLDNEIISYSGVDRTNFKLTGLSRGIEGTTPAEHFADTIIYMDLPGINVINSGRNYATTPTVTAVVDTTKYPAPRREAVLTSIMAGDKVIGVNIIDSGDGYLTTPDIVFEDAISVTSSLNKIDFIGNTIQFASLEFESGDLVYITNMTSNGYKIVPDGFYYIAIIQIQTFAIVSNAVIVSLHSTYNDTIEGKNHVVFINEQFVPSDFEIKMAIRARGIPSMVNTQVRSMKPTLRFDRTSYTNKISPWVSGDFYSSPYISIGNDASFPEKLYVGTPYSGVSGTVSPSGGSLAIFKVYNILMGGAYEAEITFGGTGYSVNDLITIPGTDLGGTSPANDCVIKVVSVIFPGIIEEIEIDTSSGTPKDVYIASLQGAVLPITDVTSEGGNTIVSVNYDYSGLKPGQVNGAYMWFYRVFTPYTYDDSGASGAIIKISRPKFNPTDINNLYYIYVVDPGSIYTTGDKITIAGSLLGGVDGVNDCVITIDANLDGSIFSTIVNGYSIGYFNQFYVKPISNTELEIYYDSKYNKPVKYVDFAWTNTSTDYGYLPEPITANYNYGFNPSSLVIYNGAIYQCIEANNDSEFDFAKWKLLSNDNTGINALDRIEAYYEPTINMPGKDLQQLVKGITYPNNVYYGNKFSPEDVLPLDFIVRDEPFYPKNFNAKASTFDGTYLYVAGYTLTNTIICKFDNEGTFMSTSVISTQALNVTSIEYSETPTPSYILTTSNSDNPIFASFDGANWVSIGEVIGFDINEYGDGGFGSSSVDVPYTSLYSALIVNNNYFLSGKSVFKSSEGYQYENKYTPNTSFPTYINKITYVSLNAFDGYVGVGLDYTLISGGGTAYPIYSEIGQIVLSTNEGSTWTKLSNSFTQVPLNSVTSSNTYIVIVGNNAEIWYSTNASNWNQGVISGPTITTNIKSVAHGSGKFVAVGDKTGNLVTDPGLILVSNDGITWTQISSSTITTNNLNQVYYGNGRFYITGEENTIISSSDGINWFDVGKIVATDPFYVVQGNDFLYGYGPEELVPGVIGDNLSMYVISAPGAYWDLDVSEGIWYKHTGFNMSAYIIPTLNINNQLSFKNLVENPARVSVFLYENATNLSTRIYEDTYGSVLTYNYSIDWFNQVITLNDSSTSSPLPDGYSLLVELYEVGNGKEIARGTSQNTPLLVDSAYNTSIFVFNTQYESVVNEPLVYVSENGGTLTKLVYGVDYTIEPTNTNLTKLRFEQLYDDTVDYIVYSVLADSSTLTSTAQYGYSIPETEVFVTDGSTSIFTVDDNLISTAGDNVDNSIVEVDGLRLIPPGQTGAQYTLSGTTLTLSTPVVDGTVVAITTFYDTSRQYLTTGLYTGGTSLQVTPVSYVNNNTTPVRVTFASDPDTSTTNISGELFRFDGVMGTTEVNGNTYYLDQIDSTNYDLYSEYISIPLVFGSLGDTFVTTTIGDASLLSIGMFVAGTNIGNGGSNGGTFITNIQPNTPTAGTYKISLSNPNIGTVTAATFCIATIGDNFSMYLGSGFGWNDASTIQVPFPTVPIEMPNMTYTEGNRTWVTINGNRLDPNYVKFYDNNYIGILHGLDTTEEVVITSMVTGASPNGIEFNVTVDKNSNSYVTRTNPNDRSWLTQKFATNDDVMHFYNVSNLVEQVTTTVNVVTVDSVTYAYVQCDINAVKQVEVYNNTTLETLMDDTKYNIGLINGRPAVIFTGGAVAGDLVTVSLIIGNIVEINGERIRFEFIDVNANTISGLTRGVQGTIINYEHDIYSVGFGITPARRLTEAEYNSGWNSTNISEIGDPLQISTTVPATFLNSIN